MIFLNWNLFEKKKNKNPQYGVKAREDKKLTYAQFCGAGLTLCHNTKVTPKHGSENVLSCLSFLLTYFCHSCTFDFCRKTVLYNSVLWY